MAADYKLKLLMISDTHADLNLHSPQRRLIESRMAHADVDSLIDLAAPHVAVDDLALRRLNKRRLLLRDQIVLLEVALDPPEPARAGRPLIRRGVRRITIQRPRPAWV